MPREVSVYRWLLFFHLAGLSVFLVVHGFSAAAAFGLRRRPGPAESRLLLQLSLQTAWVAYPALLVLVGTGVWMGFLGHWWGQAWMWTAIGVLILLVLAMGFLADPYRNARSAETDEKLAAAVAQTRPLTVTWLGAIGFAAILFLMVLKPF